MSARFAAACAAPGGEFAGGDGENSEDTTLANGRSADPNLPTPTGADGGPPAERDSGGGTTSDGGSPSPQADASAHEAGADSGTFVILYDTYAQALYLDGTFGPKTGIIHVADVIASADKIYDFWHGHGGKLHRFTLTAANFADLKKKLRVNVETTMVEGHNHKLFIDPVDTRWRVPGAQPVQVPV